MAGTKHRIPWHGSPAVDPAVDLEIFFDCKWTRVSTWTGGDFRLHSSCCSKLSNTSCTCPWGKHRSVARSRCLAYICVRTATKLESRPTSLRTNGVKENVPASERNARRRPSTRGSFRRCGPSPRCGKYFHRLQCRAKPPQQKNNSGRHSSWCSKIASYHPPFRLLLKEGPNYVKKVAPSATGARTEDTPHVIGA